MRPGFNRTQAQPSDESTGSAWLDVLGAAVDLVLDLLSGLLELLVTFLI